LPQIWRVKRLVPPQELAELLVKEFEYCPVLENKVNHFRD
jgi:hypothetical protein